MYGYARASSQDQSTDIQRDALRAAGCTVIRTEKASGTTRTGRTELATLLEFLRPGDTLMVTRLDRLARNLLDLEMIVRELGAKGAHLKVIEQAVDTSTSTGTAFMQVLGVFAQFENSIRRERQAEGIAAAKAAGVYTGRKASIDRAAVLAALAAKEQPAQIARRLGIGRASVYRIANEAATAAPPPPAPKRRRVSR